MKRITRAQGRERAPSKRTSIAYTAYRQVKLRCDAMDRFPAPCVRCIKQEIHCMFDPKFKRQPVCGSLEKVAKESERLRSLVHDAESTPSISPADAPLTAGPGSTEASVLEKITSQLPTPKEIEASPPTTCIICRLSTWQSRST
ncbi:hypothetical protein BJX70DRAFT_378879 [Aspergillus crustosus]